MSSSGPSSPGPGHPEPGASGLGAGRRGRRARRRPPKPPFYYVAQPGQCRFCGKSVTDRQGRINRRGYWHTGCLGKWKIMNWPSHARRAVWQRDQGLCCDCGQACGPGEWEVDHNEPLHKAEGRLWFWSLRNLRTRCTGCHKVKTQAENRALTKKPALGNLQIR